MGKHTPYKNLTNFYWIRGAKIHQIFTDRFAGHKEKFTEEELRKVFYMEIWKL